MLSDAQIGYGLGLNALFEVLLTVAVPRWRRPALIATTTVVTVLAVLGCSTSCAPPTPRSS